MQDPTTPHTGMPTAELTLTIPDGVWIGDLSRAYPETRFRILAALPEDGTGIGLVEIATDDHAAVLAAMQSYDEVADIDLLQHRDDVAVIQLETTMPYLLFPVQDSRIALEMPFDIVNGEAHWEVTAPQDRLSALGEQLETFDIPFDVRRVDQHIDREGLLTERQRRVITAAIEHGYYDTPRTCSLTDLAAELGIAKSTCSEILHRAEEKVVKQFMKEEAPDTLAMVSD